MAYNSANIEEFRDIWVFCEQRDGKLQNTDDVIESKNSLVIPEAANREISATVVIKRMLESL